MKPLLLALILSPALLADDASIGDFLWRGKYYHGATAKLVDTATIAINGDRGDKVTIPWDKTPWSLQTKFKAQRNELIATAAAAAAEEKREEQLRAQGRAWVGGKIIGRTAKGFLVQRADTFQAVHILAPMPNVDGETWKGYVKFNGLYEYRTAAGGMATVREYLPWDR